MNSNTPSEQSLSAGLTSDWPLILPPEYALRVYTSAPTKAGSESTYIGYVKVIINGK